MLLTRSLLPFNLIDYLPIPKLIRDRLSLSRRDSVVLSYFVMSGLIEIPCLSASFCLFDRIEVTSLAHENFARMGLAL